MPFNNMKSRIILLLAVILAAAAIAVARTADPQSASSGEQADPSGQIEVLPMDEVVPTDVAQHIDRGNRLIRDGRFEEAIAEYRAALDKSKKPLFTVYLNLGATYLQKQDHAAAADAYRKAIAIRPADTRAHYFAAESLYAAGEFKDAEAEYRKAIELTPGGVNPPAYHFLGLSLYGQQRVEEAIAEYKTAIQQAKGNYSEAQYNLGIALMTRQDYPAAESAFRLAISQEKKDWPEAHFNLASTLERQRRFREAADEYDLYLRQLPDAEDAANLRKHIAQLRKQV